MNQNHRYKLATIQDGQWVYARIFDSYESLIDFLERSQRGKVDYRDKSPKWNNEYLDNINMNFNDKYNFSYWNGERYQKITYTYAYLFVRDDEAIVDVRLFYDDIIKKYEENKNKKYYYSWRRDIKYEFRRGPVPFTGKRRKSRTRDIGYGRLVRMLNHPDYKEYNRVIEKYDELHDPWFEYPYKRRDKSWKTSFKCRKQWGKHLK